MKRTWIGVILVLALAAVLTGCRSRDAGGTASGQAGSSVTSPNGTISQDIGAADDRVNGDTPSQSGMVDDGVADEAQSGIYTGRTSYSSGKRADQRNLPEQRGGNAFLEDGRYRAGADGAVIERVDPQTRDFTQEARGMLRDVGRSVGDMGRSIADAARGGMKR